MPDDMSRESLPLGQVPALGATHAENMGLHQPTWAEQNPEASAAALIRMQSGLFGPRAELSPTVGGPVDKEQFRRQWRENCIFAGFDWINRQIQLGEGRIRRGETTSASAQIAIQGQPPVEVSLGNYLNELYLARILYQSPEEAARSLRNHENLIVREIDRYQKKEGWGVSGGARFALLNTRTPVTGREYFTKLEATQALIENPPELVEYRKDLERLKMEFGPEYLRRMADRFRRHQLVCLMPDEKDLPPYVPFESAQREIRQILRRGEKPTELPRDIQDIETLKKALEEEALRRQTEMINQMGGMKSPIGEIGGEYYMQMYQDAWNEFTQALDTFPDNVQDEIIANFIAGGMILGGQFSAFYKKAVEQHGRAPSRWTAFLDAIEHFQKTSGAKGYLLPEQIFQILGSVPPEILAFPDFHHSTHRMWLADYGKLDEKPREFTISSRDLIGHLGRIDTLAKLGVNNAFTKRSGFYAVRNGEFAEYLLRQAGIDPPRARRIAFEEEESPVLVRDSWLSTIRRSEVTNIWDWAGETALDKLQVALAWLKWSRADVEFTPLDVKRRQILSERGLELAHYRVGYSIGLPPDQFLNMIALFPSALSIDHVEMLQWVEDEWCKVKKWEDIEVGSENFNRLTVPEQNQIMRAHIWDKTRTLKRPSLASVRHLARMAMGVGGYNKRGEDFREVVHEGMEQMPKAYFDALRHPDLWKWRWFENADADPSQWRYVGNFLGDKFSEARVSAAFEGYDFTKELQACGLSDAEIAEMPRTARTGYEGWKRLLEHASLGLLEWSALNYTTGDKTWRYQKKKEAAQDATVEFLKTSSPIVPDFLDDAEDVDGETGQLADLKGAPATFRQELEKVERVNKLPGVAQGLEEALKDALEKLIPPISNSLGFILNSAQQAYLEAVINMFLDGHGAHRLDALVEDISLEKPKDVERFAGGVNWSVPVIKRKDFMPDSASGRADRRSSLPALFSEGFYFIHMPDSKSDSSDDILISPLATPLPKLIRAGELLDKIERNLESAEGVEADHAQHVRDAIKLMRDRKAFCWDTLINGRSDIPPVSLIKALNHIREEGPLTAAAKRSIMHEVLRFYKIHPKGSTRFVDKAGKKFDPYVPELID